MPRSPRAGPQGGGGGLLWVVPPNPAGQQAAPRGESRQRPVTGECPVSCVPTRLLSSLQARVSALPRPWRSRPHPLTAWCPDGEWAVPARPPPPGAGTSWELHWLKGPCLAQPDRGPGQLRPSSSKRRALGTRGWGDVLPPAPFFPGPFLPETRSPREGLQQRFHAPIAEMLQPLLVRPSPGALRCCFTPDAVQTAGGARCSRQRGPGSVCHPGPATCGSARPQSCWAFHPRSPAAQSGRHPVWGRGFPGSRPGAGPVPARLRGCPGPRALAGPGRRPAGPP